MCLRRCNIWRLVYAYLSLISVRIDLDLNIEVILRRLTIESLNHVFKNQVPLLRRRTKFVIIHESILPVSLLIPYHLRLSLILTYANSRSHR